MPFLFRELNADIRLLMGEEIQAATTGGTLYLSKRFTAVGREAWAGLLLDAARAHDEHWLAHSLEVIGAMKGSEVRAKPKGGYTTAHVPSNAEEMLADGEFNRYYMCAVCRKAIAAGEQVVVYRAKQGTTTRPESDALVGTIRDPQALLLELRTDLGHELTKPNSGLSLHTTATS